MSATLVNGTVKSNPDQNPTDETDNNHEKWALPLKVIYQLALKFFKEMEGKAVNLSYEDKIKLVALFKQVVFGKCNEENLPQLGVLDVIGKNRRLAWKELGGMSANDAMLNFINLLDDKCSLFKPYIDAHVAQKEEENRKQQKNKEKIEQEEKEKLDQANGEVNQETSIEEKKRRLIQDALNQQTYAQFRAYAEDQFPGNPEQQAVLVRQLQDQHYLQYMQQILHAHDQQPNSENKAITDIIPDSSIIQQTQEEEISEIGPANMWTLTNIKSFKEHIRKEGGDAIIKIGHGETVTVRVPTHEGGSCLYWEFCTDHYDLGFGIYFEWNKSPTNQVSVHVSETDDEMMSDVDAAYEDDDDDDDEDNSEVDYEEEYDMEDELGQMYQKDPDSVRRVSRRTTKIVNRSPFSIISPIMRRDCHQEVYAGSHCYPGEGVYLLKFDNSYSLWRSKTLYYRVYYTR
uniref:Golgi resident protein GCP60 n=1 Tax=Cacopsylla melanoneura TaxID=428564 RepID=A0A8D8PZZ1_9HEMI